jgi:cysteine desulfurase
MMPFLTNVFANASSTHHFGLDVKKSVIAAREKIAELVNADTGEIIFTSGATESINLALKGLAFHPKNTKKHIVTVQTEHKAVLDTCKYLETIGFEVDYLPVNREGILDVEQLKKLIREDTLVVCVMWVNNETGVIQPIKEASKLAHDFGALFMTDATQAVGKIKTDVLENEIDLMTFSSHKMYGPKGAGALYINKETVYNKNILPLLHGGGHESGVRSGTLNVPAIVGFGKACEILIDDMEYNEERVGKLRDLLEVELLKIKGAFINGSKTKRLYNTLNICFPNFDANMFIDKHSNIAVSNGSACTAALVQPSHVLSAMGLTEDEALGSLRISLGIMNKESDTKKILNRLNNSIKY